MIEFQEFARRVARILGLDRYPEGSQERHLLDRLLAIMTLDLPSWRESFESNRNIKLPVQVPMNRGPLVPRYRESLFLNRLSDSLGQFSSSEMFEQMKEFWLTVIPEGSAVERGIHFQHEHNAANQCPAGSAESLIKYVSFRSFSRYIPEPDNSFRMLRSTGKDPAGGVRPKSWSKSKRLGADYVKRLEATLEHQPSIAVAKSVDSPDDLVPCTFVTCKDNAPHLTWSGPIGTNDCARHVVQQMALPGYETEADRKVAGGLLAIDLPAFASKTRYRPTILDCIPNFNAFFLAGCPNCHYGETWPLVTDLGENDRSLLSNESGDFQAGTGFREWILDGSGEFTVGPNEVQIVGVFNESNS